MKKFKVVLELEADSDLDLLDVQPKLLAGWEDSYEYAYEGLSIKVISVEPIHEGDAK